MNIRKILSLVSAILCAATLVLLLADLIRPDVSLFLKPWVKLFLLVTCASVIASGGAKLQDARQRLRRRLARRRKA